MAATTFDAAFKSAAGLALSGGNLTATATAAASVGATRACSGKTYFQITLGSAIGTAQLVGLITKGFALGTTLLGADAVSSSVGYKSSDGTVKINNVTAATIQTSAANAVVDVAFDPVAQLIWFRTNNGNWNNNAANNPATGVGGISTAALTAPVYPAWGAAATGNNATAIFTAGFTNVAPVGFVTVDTIQVNGRNSAVSKTASYSTVTPGPRTPPTKHASATVLGKANGSAIFVRPNLASPSSYAFA